MKYLRLSEVSKRLGGSPRPRTLQGWIRDGLIEASKLAGGTVYVLSEEQLQKLVQQLEARDAPCPTGAAEA